MRKVLLGCAALVCSSGLAMAGQPMVLNDAQLDRVTAGQIELEGLGGANIEILTGLMPTAAPSGPFVVQTVINAIGSEVTVGGRPRLISSPGKPQRTVCLSPALRV